MPDGTRNLELWAVRRLSIFYSIYFSYICMKSMQYNCFLICKTNKIIHSLNRALIEKRYRLKTPLRNRKTWFRLSLGRQRVPKMFRYQLSNADLSDIRFQMQISSQLIREIACKHWPRSDSSASAARRAAAKFSCPSWSRAAFGSGLVESNHASSLIRWIETV